MVQSKALRVDYKVTTWK